MKVVGLFVLLVTFLVVGCANLPTNPEPSVIESNVAATGALAVTTNEKFPFTMVVWTPAEPVFLKGILHILAHTTIDSNGGFHTTSHFQPQNVSGTGLTTGKKYVATGLTAWRTNISGKGLPYTDSYLNNFRIVGQGQGNNFLVHYNAHITVNANGTVTAVVDNYKFSLK